MKYNTNIEYKAQQAREYLEKLIKNKKLIELKELKFKRSTDQNALYWLWLTVIEVESGNNRNEMHMLYRYNFLPKDDEKISKIIIPELWQKAKLRLLSFRYFPGLEDIIDIISYSTTSLETDGFSAYLEKIKAHAKDTMDIILLNLDEKNFLDFAKEYNQYR